MQELSEHAQAVREFMAKAGRELPAKPTMPGYETRKLRARLIMEEALETVKALGLGVAFTNDSHGDFSVLFVESGEPDLVEIVDGCCDLSVVAVGTLLACGVPDKGVQALVDQNNLDKFGPGGHRDVGGKWIKPAGHKPPDIAGELSRLLAEKGK